MQANFGVGIPATSFLTLDGGVLQSNGSNTVNFTRSLGTSGGTFQWTANGGGFSAGAAAMIVNIGGHATPDTLGLGLAPADVGTKIVGTLKFGSTSAAAATTFQNFDRVGRRRSHDPGRRQSELQQRHCARSCGIISGSARHR